MTDTTSVPHEGLTHLKKYDVKDSNVELIGSKLDHQVKYNSAQTEPAWKKVGKEAGLFIWRIEQFQVVQWPKEKYGKFHEGDSYIVLYSRKVGQNQNEQHLEHDIFFWLGKETSQDEAGTAAYKTVELDEYLSGKAIQHRELQDNPSSEFLSLFPRITILQGGVATGFQHVEEEKPEETLILYQITKAIPAQGSTTPSAKTSTLVKQVQPTFASLVEDDCFLLDRGTKVMIWQGKKASPIEKAKAAQVAHDLTLSRQATTEVLAQGDSRSFAFLEPLGGKSTDPIPSHGADSNKSTPTSKRPKRLFKLSDASGQLRFDLIKEGSKEQISQSDLDSQDVFLLDSGIHIWVWQGSGASTREKSSWLKVVHAYIHSFDPSDSQPHLSPVAKVNEGSENSAFRSALTA